MHRRPIIRHVARAVALATAAAPPSSSGVAGAQPVDAADGLPAGTLGQFVGYDAHARFKSMESALGRPLDRVVTMADNPVTEGCGGRCGDSSPVHPRTSRRLSNRLDVTVTIPLAFGKSRRTRRVDRRRFSGACRRPGRARTTPTIEPLRGTSSLRGTQMRCSDSATSSTAPMSSGRRVTTSRATSMRSVTCRRLFEQESAAFRFEWTGMNSTWRTHAREAYPGDAYVDIVGLDIYYRDPVRSRTRLGSRYKKARSRRNGTSPSRGARRSPTPSGVVGSATPTGSSIDARLVLRSAGVGPGKLGVSVVLQPSDI